MKVKIPDLDEEILNKLPFWERQLYYMLKEMEEEESKSSKREIF